MTPAEIKFLRWARQRMDWGFEVAGACRYYTDRAQGYRDRHEVLHLWVCR